MSDEKDSIVDIWAGNVTNLSEGLSAKYDRLLIDKLWPRFLKCHLCKESQTFHDIKGRMDHPFIKDNLDYLAWKYEQKEGLQSKPKGDIISFDKYEDPNTHQ